MKNKSTEFYLLWLTFFDAKVVQLEDDDDDDDDELLVLIYWQRRPTTTKLISLIRVSWSAVKQNSQCRLEYRKPVRLSSLMCGAQSPTNQRRDKAAVGVAGAVTSHGLDAQTDNDLCTGAAVWRHQWRMNDVVTDVL